MRNRALCLCALLALLPLDALARGPDYGEPVDAQVQRCDTLQWSGQSTAAQRCYQALLQSANAIAVRAEAAWALGDLKNANALFRQAVADARSDRLLLRWGELYIDSHQNQDALELFQEALALQPRDAFAQVDAASVLVDEFAPQAQTQLQAVVAESSAPAGARLRALLLLARIALEDSDLVQGAALLSQADVLAQQQGLSQLQLWALHGALELLAGRDPQPWIERALKLDPAYGDAYAIPAHFDVITRRQRQAIDLYQKAVRVQPELWSAQVELASCLLRENRIGEARTHLQLAYQGDPFDPVTANTLRLLDSLDQFDVLVYGTQSSGAMPALILRMDKKESAVLAPYARALAERAMAAYSQRYHYQLSAPVVVEIYPNHDDFAVRTAGMPGIGLLGVTFGYVVAMDSPSSRAVNEFHWGTTLWHELAHVYTLESTEHRVPRWLSEGLSVFEEWRTGPIKGMEIPPYAYAAFAQHRQLPVADLDQGFIRPQYASQVQVSYMQAGLICDFIDRRFGFDKLLALLHAYDGSRDTAQALQVALGIGTEQFDQQFNADLQQQFGALLQQIEPWQRARAEAIAAVARSDWGAAEQASKRALALLPQDVDDGSPWLALARSYQESGRPELLDTLQEYWHRGGHDPQALALLSQRLHAAGRVEDAIAVMQSINYVAPFDDQTHGQLGEWLLEAGRAREALQEYQVALLLKPADLATAHLRLAQAQYALHATADARREVLAALELAPNFQPAQRLLLQIVQATGSSNSTSTVH